MRKLTLGIIVLIPIITLVGAVWWVRANEAWHDKTLAAAQELCEAGDFARAQPLLARLARRFPDEIEAQYLLGEASIRNNDRVMALTAFDSVLRDKYNAGRIRSIARMIHAGVTERVVGPVRLRRLPKLSPDGRFVIYDPVGGTQRGVRVGALPPEDVRVSASGFAGIASRDGRTVVHVDSRGTGQPGVVVYRLAVSDIERGTTRIAYSSRSPIDPLWVSDDADRAVMVTKPSLGYSVEEAPTTGARPTFILLDLKKGQATAAVGFAQGLMAKEFAAASDGKMVAAVASIAGKNPLFVGRFEVDQQMKTAYHVAGGDISMSMHAGQIVVATTAERKTEISRYDPATQKTTRLTRVSVPVFAGLAFSRDGRICIYTAFSKGAAGSKGARQVVCLLETDSGRNFLLLTPKLGVYDDICSLDVSDDGRVVMYCIGRGRVVGQEEWPTHREYEIYTFDMTRTPPRRELSNQLYERLGRIIYSP